MPQYRRILAALPVVLVCACTASDTTGDRTAASSTASAAPGTTSTEDLAAVRQSIEAANAGYAEALKRGDTTSMGSQYADDAVSMPPNQDAVRGRAAILKVLGEDARAMRITDARFITEEVMVGGDLAVETGSYDIMVQQAAGDDHQEKGKYVTVWKRQPDRSLKIVRNIYNSSRSGSS